MTTNEAFEMDGERENGNFNHQNKKVITASAHGFTGGSSRVHLALIVGLIILVTGCLVVGGLTLWEVRQAKGVLEESQKQTVSTQTESRTTQAASSQTESFIPQTTLTQTQSTPLQTPETSQLTTVAISTTFERSTTESNAAKPCPEGFIKALSEGHCYLFVDKEVYWPAARADCLRRYPGAYLVTIESKEENAFIFTFIDRWNYLWLGGVRINNTDTFYWDNSGQIVGQGYTNWRLGEPNNLRGVENHIQMIADGEWNDNLTILQKYVCEYDN